ncbi:hypothetical protein CIT292_07402 [Citrobacter youngae ATCC 29220]|uniref:Uncharacterized protein n=1 Tax=Citrobacter youngae ATCC 29220 TaxID=500640 RepID=D4BAA8_9ENTR|nr:hypothetical protein CIT292_07402 [Citrobacter youngae ATCC 29220]
MTLYNVIPAGRNKIICADCKMTPPAAPCHSQQLFMFHHN